MKRVLIALLLACEMYATILLEPQEAMAQSFGEGSLIEKESIVLTKDEAQQIESHAKSKLESKIVRIFYAKKEAQIIGYGVLLSKKIRSKNGVTLYIFDAARHLKAIEVVAFNEPLEYLPNKSWSAQFSGKTESDTLSVGRDIPTITGATLSARAVTDGARLAFAVLKSVQER